MGIINRTKDSSEQTFSVSYNVRPTATSTTDLVFQIPQAGTILAGQLSAVGLSGSPTAAMAIKRFVVGAGETLIPIGAALALVATSTSGPQSYTFSSTALQAGDVLSVTHAGSNAAVQQLNVAVAIQSTQDIKTWTFS